MTIRFYMSLWTQMTLFETIVDAVHILFLGSRDRSCRVDSSEGELPERNVTKNDLKGLFHDAGLL